MIEGIYWFGDYQRWNLGWPNPNPSGAFIAMLIPLMWWIQGIIGRVARRVIVRWAMLFAAFTIELALWFLMMKTYSRGALIAILCGVVFRLLVSVRPRFWNWSSMNGLALVGIRVVAVGILLVATGFIERACPAYVQSDASVINRLDLWSGGLRMIAAEPLSGWGKGESGPQFMHWYQPIDSTDGYAGMVNSWLHRAVEHGLPSLLPWLWVLLMLVFLGWVVQKRRPEAMAAEGMLTVATVWVVFAVANVFSTLWIFPNLWWVPGVGLLAGVFILAGLLWQKQLSPRVVFACLFISGGSAAVALAVVRLAGQWLNQEDAPVIASSHISLGPDLPRQWLLVPDSAVLGRDYGKQVRVLAEAMKHQGIGLNVPRQQHEPVSVPVETALLLGESCANAPPGLTATQVVLVHPAGPPRNFPSAKTVILLLPALEADSSVSRWRRHAEAQGWTVSQSGALSEDARHVWPIEALYNIRP